MDNISDRLARMEARFDGLEKRHEELETRADKRADQLQEFMHDVREVDHKMDQLTLAHITVQSDLQDLRADQEKDQTLLKSLDDTRKSVKTAWWVTKLLGGVVGGFFTAALLIGDKAVKIWSLLK